MSNLVRERLITQNSSFDDAQTVDPFDKLRVSVLNVICFVYSE